MLSASPPVTPLSPCRVSLGATLRQALIHKISRSRVHGLHREHDKSITLPSRPSPLQSSRPHPAPHLSSPNASYDIHIRSTHNIYHISSPTQEKRPLYQFVFKNNSGATCLIFIFSYAVEEKTRQDKTRQDNTRQDKTRQDKTRQDKTRQDKTSHHT